MSVIDLPLPPSVNRLWRSNRGRVHRSAPYAAWLKEPGWELVAQRPPHLTGGVSVSVSAGRPDKGRRDLDNIATKAVLDLLVAHQVIADDSMVAKISATWASLFAVGIGRGLAFPPPCLIPSWGRGARR
jgi:crossover junction endodeoxyribonuclease RusA